MTEAVARIPLRRHDGSVRAWAVVDTADLAGLSAWRWSLHSAGYAARKVTVSGRKVTILLHRQIIGLEAGDPREVDHINNDKLDNRRENLRAVTKAQNRQNIASRAGTSAHRGVCWDKKTRTWRAFAQVNYRVHRLGNFASEEEAARVAAAFRAERMPYSLEGSA